MNPFGTASTSTRSRVLAAAAAAMACATFGAATPAHAGLSTWTPWKTSTASLNQIAITRIAPGPDRINVGTDGYGVLKGAIGGAGVFAPANDGVNMLATSTVNELAYGEGNLYAGQGSSKSGLYWNSSGSSWSQLSKEDSVANNLGTPAVNAIYSSGTTLIAGLAGGTGARRSADMGKTFAPPIAGLKGTTVFDLAGAAGSNVIFAGTDKGLARSTDFGASFAFTPTGIVDKYGNGNLQVKKIYVSPTSPHQVWIATSSDGIFRSTDAGNTFTKANGGYLGAALGDERVSDFIISPAMPRVIFAATQKGVWASASQGLSWEQLSNVGLPNNAEITTALGMAQSDPLSLHVGTKFGLATMTLVPPTAINTAVQPTGATGPGGKPKVGDTLKVDTSKNFKGTAPLLISVTWERCEKDGKTNCKYKNVGSSTTVTKEDEGHALKAVSTVKNVTPTELKSSSAAVIVPGVPVFTVKPTIPLQPEAGVVLKATPAKVTSDVGTATIKYQWYVCDNPHCYEIDGATSLSFTPKAGDVDKELELVATATNSIGSYSATAYSQRVAPAPKPGLPVFTKAPAVPTTTPWTYQTFTGTAAAATGATAAITYQWLRCTYDSHDYEVCTAIAGATKLAYTPVSQDSHHQLKLRATATNAKGSKSAVSFLSQTVPFQD